MQPDVDALADLVVLTIKTSLGPVLERLAAAETRLERLAAAEMSVADLRDRLVASETKAGMPAATMPPDPLLGELRDRVMVMETKATAPTVAETMLLEIKDRIAALEGRALVMPSPVSGEDFAAVRDRLVVLETRTTGPSVAETALVDVRERVASIERRVQDEAALKECAALRERVAVLETRAPVPGPAGQDGKDGVDVSGVEVTKELSALRERIAVVEVRAQSPGPPGKDGADGKDGSDGMGFDDLSVAQDGERGVVVRGVRGERVKDLGSLTFPVEIYRGVYLDGKAYELGDSVTWGGSEWHCNETTTTKPGDGSKAWTLKVKRGRDGKDGRDAPQALPVVSVGRAT